MVDLVDEILRDAPDISTLTAPELNELFQDTEAPTYKYSKSWVEGKNDPWLVFPTSGTTGMSST